MACRGMALNRHACKKRLRCRFGGIALTAVLASTLVSAAYGQVRQIPNSVEPGRDRPLPIPAPPDSDFDFRIEAPKRAPVPRAADELSFLVSEIKIVGGGAPSHIRRRRRRRTVRGHPDDQ